MDLIGCVIFIVALLFSVMLHETGHFVTAKKFGMKVTRYFVAFGPTLWSTRRGETEYGIKALPLGGFVKIIGMHSLDDVDDPADEPRSFRRHPAWQRIVVLCAGSFMHFVLAFLLIFSLALGIGIANDNTTQLGTVSTCVASSTTQLANGTCAASDKPSHATLAGVKGRSGGYLGIAPTVVFSPANPVRATQYAGSAFGQVLVGSVKAVGALPAALPKLFSKDRGSTAAGQVSSVVGAAEATGTAVAAKVGWQFKVSFVLLLIASLNIFVGAFNMLPLLPL